MSKDNGFQRFREGDRVRVTASNYILSVGDVGTIQEYICDYGNHVVAVKFDSLKNAVEIDEDYLEAVEDSYEYNVERTSLVSGSSHLQFDGWLDRETAVDQYNGYVEAEDIHEEEAGFRFATYKMVKRRKAGRVENV